MCTPWLLILQPQHLRIALSQGKKKAWMFNLPVSLPPTISSINRGGLKDTLVCLLSYCPAFFSFVLSLNNITITPSFLCLLPSSLPDSLSLSVFIYRSCSHGHMLYLLPAGWTMPRPALSSVTGLKWTASLLYVPPCFPASP